MTIALRQVVGKAGDTTLDRLSERTGGDVRSHIAQDALDALAPLEILGAQMRQLLPDADVVGRRSGEGGLAQHVKGHVRELVHGPILRVFAVHRAGYWSGSCA